MTLHVAHRIPMANCIALHGIRLDYNQLLLLMRIEVKEEHTDDWKCCRRVQPIAVGFGRCISGIRGGPVFNFKFDVFNWFNQLVN